MNLVIDLGGSTTRVALFDASNKISVVEKYSTKLTLLEQKQSIESTLRGFPQRNEINYICVGIPGSIDIKTSTILGCANIQYLENTTIYELLPSDIGRDNVVVFNDAAFAGLGEAILGSGKSFETVAYITISTGVGGVRIHNKHLDTNQKFYEPGHHIIATQKGSEIVHTTLEDLASGKNFMSNFSVEAKDCIDKDIWEEYGKVLALGLINITAFWAPDVIVIGGGLSNKFDHFINPLLEEFDKRTQFTCPKILKSHLGDDSGLHGGNAFINQWFSSI